MNKKDFVSYEQAVKLKELGFTQDSFGKYINYKEATLIYGRIYENNKYEVLAPTLSQAAKWLREVKDLFIEITLETPGYFWEVKKCSDPDISIIGGGYSTTYEVALNKGINAALSLKI